MFCHSCGKQFFENARFCSHCGAESIKTNDSTQTSAVPPDPIDFLSSASPKELYDKAFYYYEDRDFVKAEQICTLIFNHYPESRQVSWVINNLPLAVDRMNLSKNTMLLVKQKQTQRDVFRFIIGVALLGGTYYLFDAFRDVDYSTIGTICHIITGLIGISGLVVIGNVLFNKRDR